MKIVTKIEPERKSNRALPAPAETGGSSPFVVPLSSSALQTRVESVADDLMRPPRGQRLIPWSSESTQLPPPRGRTGATFNPPPPQMVPLFLPIPSHGHSGYGCLRPPSGQRADRHDALQGWSINSQRPLHQVAGATPRRPIVAAAQIASWCVFPGGGGRGDFGVL